MTKHAAIYWWITRRITAVRRCQRRFRPFFPRIDALITYIAAASCGDSRFFYFLRKIVIQTSANQLSGKSYTFVHPPRCSRILGLWSNALIATRVQIDSLQSVGFISTDGVGRAFMATNSSRAASLPGIERRWRWRIADAVSVSSATALCDKLFAVPDVASLCRVRLGICLSASVRTLSYTVTDYQLFIGVQFVVCDLTNCGGFRSSVTCPLQPTVCPSVHFH